MSKMPEALRKAAVLIDSLDQHSADALLEQMGQEQAAKVRSAVLDLHDVSPAERERVIAEFLGRTPRAQHDHPGVELDAELASKFGAHETPGHAAGKGPPIASAALPASESAAAVGESGVPHVPSPRPFEFLHEATPNSLAALLAREHPQTAALVLAHLAPEHSAQVLETLPAALQVEVIRRIVDLDEADPEVLREVERQIAAMLSHELRAIRRHSAGLANMSAILAVAGNDGRQSILSNLAGVDDQLASKLSEATGQVAATPAGSRSVRQLDASESPEQGSIEPLSLEQRTLDDRAAAGVSRSPASRAETRQQASRSQTSNGATSRTGTSRTEAARPREHQPPQRPSRKPSTSARPSSDQRNAGNSDALPPDPAPLEFQTLVELDDRSLAAVFAASQADVVLLALTGASQRLVQRVLKQLASKDARALRRRLKQTGPVQLRDIERAQQQLARTAARLAAAGEIRVPAARRFAVAA